MNGQDKEQQCLCQSTTHPLRLDNHTHDCRAKDSSAQLANAWRPFQVQQVFDVTMTVPLTLAADKLTDARAQAARITTGSNDNLSI